MLFGGCSAAAWDGTSLRLALAVDSFIYLANVRPEYKWAFFGGSTCVYAFKRKDLEEHSVMFWDIVTGERLALTKVMLLPGGRNVAFVSQAGC